MGFIELRNCGISRDVDYGQKRAGEKENSEKWSEMVRNSWTRENVLCGTTLYKWL